MAGSCSCSIVFSGQILGELPGGSSMELVLTLVPVTPGLHVS